jgi:crotonobetainyl-CoA:carnitine CoA-transferase CaiB-like acyl-CoA transferase
MTLPLSGIRILDLSRLLPGGYCTQLLADLGAEVVKVETPRIGDYARIAPEQFGGDGLFHAVNRGKKSLAVNFRNARGRQILLRLVESADVVFETFRPGLVQRWKIDYEAVKAINPRVVYCSLSGYGQDGPYRDRAGHDINYMAVSGLLDFNGLSGGVPVPPGVQVADMGGGMLAALTILAGLLGRAQTGMGGYFDVGMMDLAVSWAAPVIGALFSATGQDPARGRGPLSGGLPCYNVYRTLDRGYLSFGALEPPLWATFCKTIEREDLLSRQFEAAAIPEVAAIFETKSSRDWVDIFAGLEVCLEPVHAYSEMLAHPQVRHRGLVSEREGQAPAVGSPLRRGLEQLPPAPELGEHTQRILADAGYSEGEIQAFYKDGTIKIVDN